MCFILLTEESRGITYMSGQTGWARNVQSGTTKVRGKKSLEKDKALSAEEREL